MFRKKKEKKVGAAEKDQVGYCPFEGLGRDRGFLCRDMALCVVTWFLGYRQLLGCDKGFPGRDRVVFFWFSVATGVLPVSR